MTSNYYFDFLFVKSDYLDELRKLSDFVECGTSSRFSNERDSFFDLSDYLDYILYEHQETTIFIVIHTQKLHTAKAVQT